MYERFDAPVTALDCGAKCAEHNPHGIPFCCDICRAVPVAYHQEWDYLRRSTDLWHIWRGDECPEDPTDPQVLQEETPEHMLLLACKGPALCQRDYRAVSCRQFPFYPYITYDYRFVGLAWHWDFEPLCWVISHTGQVTEAYRQEFVDFYDKLFETWPLEMESYAILSDEMREHFENSRRRIPLLHRNGGFYLVSPGTDTMRKVPPDKFPRFQPYLDD